VIGGARVGLVAVQWPQILGIGYETTATAMEFTTQLLVVLVLSCNDGDSLGSGL